MTRLTLPRPFAPKDDTGTTLVEMIVVVAILGVILAMVQGAVITASKTSNQNASRIVTAQDAKVGIGALTKNLRTAVLPQLVAGGSCTTCPSVAFVQGTPTSVQFYANNNNDQARLGPSKMTYSLVNGVLTETMQKPDAHLPTVFSYTYCTPGPTCKVAKRVVARGINSTKIFTYFNKAGTEMTGSSLNASQLSQVDSIDVIVPVKQGEISTTLIQRVTLTNADAVPEVTPTA